MAINPVGGVNTYNYNLYKVNDYTRPADEAAQQTNQQAEQQQAEEQQNINQVLSTTGIGQYVNTYA